VEEGSAPHIAAAMEQREGFLLLPQSQGKLGLGLTWDLVGFLVILYLSKAKCDVVFFCSEMGVGAHFFTGKMHTSICWPVNTRTGMVMNQGCME